MIKVINHGNYYKKPQPPTLYECKCCRCKCVFNFTFDDTIIDYNFIKIDYHFINDLREFRHVIECPECGLLNTNRDWRIVNGL